MNQVGNFGKTIHAYFMYFKIISRAPTPAPSRMGRRQGWVVINIHDLPKLQARSSYRQQYSTLVVCIQAYRLHTSLV